MLGCDIEMDVPGTKDDITLPMSCKHAVSIIPCKEEAELDKTSVFKKRVKMY